MESGAFRLEPRPTQLAKVLQNVLSGMQISSRASNVQLSLHLSDAAKDWFQADPTRISQVVSNYVSNALKFVPKDGTGLVEVQAFAFDVNDFDEMREAIKALLGKSPSSAPTPDTAPSLTGKSSCILAMFLHTTCLTPFIFMVGLQSQLVVASRHLP
jgi:hypothetical protein